MPIKNKSPFGNNVYLPNEQRQTLEDLTLQASLACGRTLSASRFMRYLIEHYGQSGLKKITQEGLE